MLTLTLRGLERDGLITRTIFATIPPRVDYELTDLGRGLSGPVAALGNWTMEHLTEIEAARLLTQRAASMKDAGMKTTQESSMAKLYSSEVAVRVANEGVQIHGGYGFIKDYPAEKFYRDVKLCTIGEGTSEIQRLVIARQVLKSHHS